MSVRTLYHFKWKIKRASLSLMAWLYSFMVFYLFLLFRVEMSMNCLCFLFRWYVGEAKRSPRLTLTLLFLYCGILIWDVTSSGNKATQNYIHISHRNLLFYVLIFTFILNGRLKLTFTSLRLCPGHPATMNYACGPKCKRKWAVSRALYIKGWDPQSTDLNNLGGLELRDNFIQTISIALL